MNQNPYTNKGKQPFSDLQGDDSTKEKVSLTHTMKRNLRRRKACAFHRAMKEKPTTIEIHETPVRVWRPKSKVTVPNKKINQDTEGLIRIAFKKCRSPIKFIFDAKCWSYICIPQAKHGPQTRISETKCGPQSHIFEAKRGSHTHISKPRCWYPIHVSTEKCKFQSPVSTKNNLAFEAHRLSVPINPA